MRPIKIVTDSGADLPAEVLEDLDISVVPLVVVAGDKAYNETELDRDTFWQLLEQNGALKTSQPSVGMYQQAYQRLVDLGNDVLCFCITSRHSGTYSSAQTAAAKFAGRVQVVDSLGLSLVMGFQVIVAAKMARLGARLGDIVEAARAIRERSHVTFQLRTLEYLRRGGRAARLMPAVDRVARALNLTILLTLTDGELKLSGVSRSYKQGLRRIRDEAVRLAPLESLGIVHTRIPEVAQRMADELAALTGFRRESVIITELGAGMSCHGGEGMIGAVAVRQAP
ncbi:MAG: DegV family protein [Chloroflexi bacterium]|nr:DegV family protein [Chloroflexota bacterium]